MRSGYTAVVGGVVAVGLVLAVLSFAGGSSDNTDQESALLLAAAIDGSGTANAHPSVVATTMAVVPRGPIADSERKEFCRLAAEFGVAFRNSYGLAGPPSNAKADWDKQLEFLSVAASLVLPEVIDPLSGMSWRSLMLAASDSQSAMNVELAQVGWNLGAYPDTISSSRVGEAPSRLTSQVCGTDVAG